MVTLGLNLAPSDAKIARAYAHFETLKRECDSVLNDRNPYSYRVSEIDPNGWCVVSCVQNYTPELGLGVILGDLVHNLRSALDYIVAALVEASGIKPRNNHQFPIYADMSAYTEKVGTQTSVIPTGRLGGITHGINQIWDLQPFNGKPNTDSHPLFVINRFSNADKHRIAAINIARPEGGKLAFSEGIVTERQRLLLDPRWNPKLEYKFARVRFARPFPANPQVEGSIAVSIHFGTPGFGQNPVGQAIGVNGFEMLCEYVADVTNIFRAL